MVVFEALNALSGDCLLLSYGDPGEEKFWLIDGGPQTDHAKNITVWRDVLMKRLRGIKEEKPFPVALGMVSHIDRDHIFGMMHVVAKAVEAKPLTPEVQFDQFWFNSFTDLVGPAPSDLSDEAKAETAVLQSLVSIDNLPGVDDEHAQMIMQNVAEGDTLANDLTTLRLQDNPPFPGRFVMASKGQRPVTIAGASVTVLGPLERRLNALRKDWAAALREPTKEARRAALQELFLPARSQDKSVTNLSSIVVLVEIGERKLLLTGDAHGDDIVDAWEELELGDGPVKIDLLKMPHHGSIRNSTEKFLKFFVADHYVFSGDGRHGNPDGATIEAVVKMHGERAIEMHFTNRDVSWKKPYELEKNARSVANLEELLNALGEAYPGAWTANLRKDTDQSVAVKLA
jgi:hypothetical protein